MQSRPVWKTESLSHLTKRSKVQTKWRKVWFKIHLTLFRNLKYVRRWQTWPTTNPTLYFFNVCSTVNLYVNREYKFSFRSDGENMTLNSVGRKAKKAQFKLHGKWIYIHSFHENFVFIRQKLNILTSKPVFGMKTFLSILLDYRVRHISFPIYLESGRC